MESLKVNELVKDGERYVSKRVRLSDRSVAIIRETNEGWKLFTGSGTPDEKEYTFDTLAELLSTFSLYTYSD